ncbi:phospholipid methyltransferase [Paenibacillus sp. RC67]|uniref:class I SAM-dependent methyltransferase n=1 Tax=Paenibacillus sp. RC67 TaxID=3039392 RepID=UPI0024ACCAE9|nr:phospholipid methyltransferase [Paenibacillus sp. RC67]
MMKAVQEKLLFLYKFSQKPGEIGSVTPSSAFLAKKMLQYVPWDEVKQIAELGAGTGAITKHLVSNAPANVKVLLFEKDLYLRSSLTRRFPDCSCYADACKLQLALHNEGVESLDCILSGLPFFNFSQPIRDQLLDQITVSLRPGGRFIAFQYSQQMRQQLSEKLDIEHVHFVPLNLPPAFVYVCRKK